MNNTPVSFTKEMKKTHTILIPEMLSIHFQIIRNVFVESGYKAELLSNKGPQIAQIGLKYVHNDTCYPALLVIGQMIDALQSGRYDVDKVALVITQTGGGCRASNYVHLLRKALQKAGFSQVPVVCLSLQGIEENPGFKITLPMIRKTVAAVAYGDALMLLSNQVRPYERDSGATDALLESWINRICDMFRAGRGYGLSQVRRRLVDIAKSFEEVPVVRRNKIKVGVVGEIYMKYSPLGNNGLEQFLHDQNCEYMIPGVLAFAMYGVNNSKEDYRLYGGSAIKTVGSRLLMFYLTQIEKAIIGAVSKTRFTPPGAFAHTRRYIDGVVDVGCKMGEGWLLTAEMLELVDMGYPNIVCAQPFGCLPNHVNGRGMMNKIKRKAPTANIVAIDYDPSAPRVNQENRIKLMLASAESTQPELYSEEEQSLVASAVQGIIGKAKTIRGEGKEPEKKSAVAAE